MSATQTFVSWVWGLPQEGIPPHVRRSAARHVTDGIGCLLGGLDDAGSAPARRVAQMSGGPPESTYVGFEERGPAPAAALANGAALHALDFDDTHADSLVHTTAAVLPAALAVGEHVGASGRDLLTAVVAGYEVVTRLGAAVQHGFHRRGFHATSVCGVFASALTTCWLSKTDEATAVHAMGIAGSLAAGSLEFLGSSATTKVLHPGLAAHAGITAARLAMSGATGPSTVLEGRYGVFATHAGERVDEALLVDGLGDRWETGHITLKPYPCCQLSHASLDAARAIATRVHGEIRRILVDVPADSLPIVADGSPSKIAPLTAYEAKFALPWQLATLLLDGDLTPTSFGRLDRPETLALARLVEIREARPESAAGAAPGRVEVTFADGSSAVGEVAGSSGDQGAVMTDDDVVAKFVGNAGGGHSTLALAQSLLALDACTDLTTLLKSAVR